MNEWSEAKRAAVERFLSSQAGTSGQAALGLSVLLESAESGYPCAEDVCPDCGGEGAELPNGIKYCNCEVPV